VAMNTALSTPRLACGRDAARVWEDAETGRLDAHEHRCPHCQAVAADAVVLHASTAELAAEPIEPPPALVDRVMSMVRTELRHDYLPLPARHGPAASSTAPPPPCCATPSTRCPACGPAAAASPCPTAWR